MVFQFFLQCYKFLTKFLCVLWKIIGVKLATFIHIMNRDIRFLVKASKAVKRARKYEKENVTIVEGFKQNFQKNPEKVCFLFEDTSWTIKQVEDYSNRVSRLFSSFVDKGEVVALFLPNRPEYACIWLGCAKVGIISSLINTNLRMKPLLHCVNISKPKAIIYSNQYESALAEILADVEGNPKYYSFEGGSTLLSCENFEEALESAKKEKIAVRPQKFSDVVLYIFTSGTTGLPKPAKITHSKLRGLALAADVMIGLKEDDVFYSPMPMYHGACSGCVVTAFLHGLTVILKAKFSASAFISDCRKYNATAAQYIGEMLRYIVNTPEQPGERNHSLRLLSGNGVTADVWKKFVKRFNVPNIVEYYGSTEGNFLLVNNQNVVGCCGFLPIGLPFYHLIGPSIIKIDPDNGEPKRNKKGHCTLVEPGETGLCIGYCVPGNEMRKFYGYLNKSDSDSKIIRNVFKDGDSAFNTGDLMVMDERGWITFVDRCGDTYRWKGENVSTTEVESIINSYPFVEDSAVYGVKVGELEGKAGMAAVQLKKLDVEGLNRYLELSLPPYARPLFLRLVHSLQYTSTFKVIKQQLKKDGYDISLVKDPLLVKLKGSYIPLTNDIYQQIQEGNIKL